MINIRPYKAGDEFKIVDLFKVSINQCRTVDYWRWANKKNPFSKSLSVITENEDGDIVGHYAVMQYQLKYKNLLLRVGFGSQLVIHPSFRNFKLMWDLLEKVWDYSKKNKLDIIFAFPNDNIWPIIERCMDWKLLKRFKSMQFNMKNSENKNYKDGLKLQRINSLTSFEDLINDLWTRSTEIHKNQVHLEKKYDFVNWRFFQHPLEHYPFFLVKNPNDIVVGWIALKFFQKNAILYGHIVDFVVTDEKYEENLIRQAIKCFSRYRVQIVSTWGGEAIKKKYEKMGFRENGFETNFGIKFLDKEMMNQNITDYSLWDLQMSYSDAF